MSEKSQLLDLMIANAARPGRVAAKPAPNPAESSLSVAAASNPFALGHLIREQGSSIARDRVNNEATQRAQIQGILSNADTQRHDLLTEAVKSLGANSNVTPSSVVDLAQGGQPNLAASDALTIQSSLADLLNNSGSGIKSLRDAGLQTDSTIASQVTGVPELSATTPTSVQAAAAGNEGRVTDKQIVVDENGNVIQRTVQRNDLGSVQDVGNNINPAIQAYAEANGLTIKPDEAGNFIITNKRGEEIVVTEQEILDEING